MFCTLGQVSLSILLRALGSVTVHSHCIITFNYLARVLRPFDSKCLQRKDYFIRIAEIRGDKERIKLALF